MSPDTSVVAQSIVATIIVAIFVLLTLEKLHRVLIVFAAVALLWLITYSTPYRLMTFEGTIQALDLNVLFLLASMMAIVGVLKSTGVFRWAVVKIMERSRGRPTSVTKLVSWFTGTLSAFMDNVTTVIFVTPMVTGMSHKLGIRPVVFLLPMVMAANIGGTATLIGDPPNIMIGSGAPMPFMEFIFNLAAPVIVMMFMLDWYSARYFRREMHSHVAAAADISDPDARITDPTLLKWTIVITAAVFAGFVTHGITHMPPAIPATIGAAAALIVQDILYLRKHRPTHAERQHGMLGIIEREIEWPTLLFFTFLFIVVGAAVQTGLISSVANGLTWAIHSGAAAMGLSPQATLLFAAFLLLWVSGVLSAFIDNIPYVAVAIPIVAYLTTQLPGNTQVLWWALALGACLGGNGTMVGASANVTTVGLAEKDGTRITFNEFTNFGARVTALTLLISSVFLAAFIYLGGRPTMWWGLGIVAVIAAFRFIRRQPHTHQPAPVVAAP